MTLSQLPNFAFANIIGLGCGNRHWLSRSYFRAIQDAQECVERGARLRFVGNSNGEWHEAKAVTGHIAQPLNRNVKDPADLVHK